MLLFSIANHDFIRSTEMLPSLTSQAFTILLFLRRTSVEILLFHSTQNELNNVRSKVSSTLNEISRSTL